MPKKELMISLDGIHMAQALSLEIPFFIQEFLFSRNL